MDVWQIASGANERDYATDFVRLGLVCVGGEKNVKRMKRVAKGEVIILKRGTSEVVAVGEVVERDGLIEAETDPDDDWMYDFDGWNLTSHRYVDWRLAPADFPAQGLTRGTIRASNTPALRERAQELVRTGEVAARTPLERPRKVEDEEILSFLIDRGMRPSAAEELTVAFRRIRLLARHYYDKCEAEQCDWSDVREHEIRTFLVVPLLLALGWAEQQMKIELGLGKAGRIDIACFEKPYFGATTDKANSNTCRLIIETKGFGHGLDPAATQAKEYAEHFPECETLVVTNGYCYKTFHRDGERKFAEPAAYLNLLRPRSGNIRFTQTEDVGALQVLEALLPR